MLCRALGRRPSTASGTPAGPVSACWHSHWIKGKFSPAALKVGSFSEKHESQPECTCFFCTCFLQFQRVFCAVSPSLLTPLPGTHLRNLKGLTYRCLNQTLSEGCTDMLRPFTPLTQKTLLFPALGSSSSW